MDLLPFQEMDPPSLPPSQHGPNTFPTEIWADTLTFQSSSPQSGLRLNIKPRPEKAPAFLCIRNNFFPLRSMSIFSSFPDAQFVYVRNHRSSSRREEGESSVFPPQIQAFCSKHSFFRRRRNRSRRPVQTTGYIWKVFSGLAPHREYDAKLFTSSRNNTTYLGISHRKSNLPALSPDSPPW